MSSHKMIDDLKIPLKDVVKATDNFAEKNLIREGGFGRIYKGTLFWVDVAVRRLHGDYGQGDLEFWNEISMLSGLKHQNLVFFIGYCDEQGEKIIIYEYEVNKSLDKHLDDPNLTWKQRLQICVGIARGLSYIYHDEAHDFSIIHRNIKSSKVLLDKEWKPKLSGFEHSMKNTRARMHRLLLAEVVGTIGYVDPTYEKTGFVNHKSDVFSFGVLLFEVLCGRRAFVPDQKDLLSPQFSKQKTKEFVEIVLDEPPRWSTGLEFLGNWLIDSVSSKVDGYVQSSSFVDRKPSSFVDRKPSSFADGGYRKSSSYVGNATSLSQGSSSSSFVERKALSFGGGYQKSSDVEIAPSLSLASSLNPFGHVNVHTQAYYNEKNKQIIVPNRSRKLINNTQLPHISDGNNKQTPSHDVAVPPIKTSWYEEHVFRLHPLFTMKKVEQYQHSPNEELLSHLAKSHYDDEESLNDIIYSPLKEQMDPQSFQIFSKTAYECLKEQRQQRPNIDQILRNLEKALELQIARDEPTIVAKEVEGTSSHHLKADYLEHLRIPLTDIQSATDDFTKSYLGSGGYGKVYGAKLELSIEDKLTGEITKKGRSVAIKCIAKGKYGKQGFIAEIKLLTRCKHDNIVSLLGFCDEGDELILVYERVSNGSLDDYLGNTHYLSYLPWVQRLKICIDIARGLNYLHNMKEEDKQTIVHRDIKSGNILLGKNWVAKIADFGLSKFHHVDQQEITRYSKNIAGTNVYICPEYRVTGKFKRAIDIYSLGVVLFEIVCGKLAYDDIYLKENEDGIAHVARQRFIDGTLHEMVDPKIMEEVDELTSALNKGPNQDSLKTFLAIAHQCVAQTQKDRPTSQHILDELLKSLSSQENNKNKLQMSFEEIKAATQNFNPKNLIGGGGFGRVYIGEVKRGNELHTVVAKRLDRSKGQGEHQFLMELEILFEYKHENIIGLEGYCNENNEKIIVYEHAAKTSLDRHLEKVSLTWIIRLKICIDIASGLSFLHGGASTNEIVIHRDIKTANILLNDDWKAKISDFGLSAITALNQEVISTLVGTDGYVDPEYEFSGFFTEKSDIYSLGVVLFEILYGQLLVRNLDDYDQEHVRKILKNIHEEGKLDLIVFERIKGEIVKESLSTFRKIVSQCLDKDRGKRPTAEEVLQKLNEALELQEEYDIWEAKLPKEYKKIIQMSKSPGIYSAKKKKDLYNILISEGILLQEDKRWFSLGSNGESNEMISAREFSYINNSPHKWRSVPGSRFQEVAEMLDHTNLNIKITTKAQFLSRDAVYGAYLIFKFCDSRKYSSEPIYVSLKYKNKSEKLHAYFAAWRDSDWMMIELCQFLNYKEDFEFLLESFSGCYCGDGVIYVEGIEFRSIDNAKHEETKELTNVQQGMKTNLNEGQLQQSPLISQFYLSFKEKRKEIFIRSKNHDNDAEKLFWLIEVNNKKHLMVSAKAALYDFSNVKLFTLKPLTDSRFEEVIELLPQQVFLINCTVKSQMLSQDTEYVCYLVFKLSKKCHGMHYPVKVRDLLQENKEPEILFFESPTPWNLHNFTRVPKQREDGWMEVNVWKFNSNHEIKNECLSLNLKFTSYEEPMSGLILCGLEFRPI